MFNHGFIRHVLVVCLVVVCLVTGLFVVCLITDLFVMSRCMFSHGFIRCMFQVEHGKRGWELCASRDAAAIKRFNVFKFW